MARLIHPIYDFTNNHEQFSNFIYTATLFLWGITIYKLYSKVKSGEIESWKDIFSWKKCKK